MAESEPAKFDLDAQLARIDRQQAALHVQMEQTSASVARGGGWLWALALIVPVAVGAVLAYAL